MTLFAVAYADGRAAAGSPIPGGAGLLLSLTAVGDLLGAVGYGTVAGGSRRPGGCCWAVGARGSDRSAVAEQSG
jgi:hypothetical protein